MSAQGTAELTRICAEINEMSDDEFGKLFDSINSEQVDPFHEFCSVVFLGDISTLQQTSE